MEKVTAAHKNEQLLNHYYISSSFFFMIFMHTSHPPIMEPSSFYGKPGEFVTFLHIFLS